MVAVSLQAVYHEARLFAEHFVPSFLGFIALMITWSAARHFGRKYEQGQIRKYLPQIAQDELREREAKIRALEKGISALREENAELGVFMKFAVQRCNAIIEQSKDGEK